MALIFSSRFSRYDIYSFSSGNSALSSGHSMLSPSSAFILIYLLYQNISRSTNGRCKTAPAKACKILSSMSRQVFGAHFFVLFLLNYAQFLHEPAALLFGELLCFRFAATGIVHPLGICPAVRSNSNLE